MDIEAKRGPTRYMMRVAIVLLAMAGLSVAGYWYWIGPQRQTEHSAGIHTIALLPLENMSGDPPQDFFADAMTDELVTKI